MEQYLRERSVSMETGFLPDNPYPSNSVVFDKNCSNMNFNVSHNSNMCGDEKRHHQYEKSAIWMEDFCKELPKYYVAGKVRHFVEKMPIFDTRYLLECGSKYLTKDEHERVIERAFLLLCLLTNSYVHGNSLLKESPTNFVPSPLSTSIYELSQYLKRPAILSHASCCLNNWNPIFDHTYSDLSLKKKVKNEDIRVDRIKLLNNLIGGIDEDWFFLVTAEVEAKAAPGITSATKIMKTIQEYQNSDQESLTIEDLERVLQDSFKSIAKSLFNMRDSFKSMTKQCDPYIFYSRVRLMLSGWDQQSFPNGVIYESCSPNNESQYFYGGSAAQSSIMHVFDILFDVKHGNKSGKLLKEMRKYMVYGHQCLLDDFENFIQQDSGTLQSYVADLFGEKESSINALSQGISSCIENMTLFRNYHLHIVNDYIVQQSQDMNKEKGTGSSNVLDFLSSIRDETKSKILK